MTLTKASIIQTVSKELSYSKNRSTRIVESLLDIIKQSLAAGDGVLVSGFGKFCVREKSERKGRNPATGKDLMLRPRKVVTFRCSGKFRNKINKG